MKRLMSGTLEETKFIMNKYHIKANKSLGQNFLVDDDVINAIVKSSDVNNEDLVIEIGPGLGTLTKCLLEKAGKVICIELDKKMIRILEDRFSLYKNFEVIHQDVLKVDLKNLIKKEKEKSSIKSVKVVANLPYYITTPIIMKLLEDELDLQSITVMIQKEVANRLIAIPGDKETGSITYTVFYYASSEGIIEVSNNAFIPEPEVTSKVIKLNIRQNPPVDVKNTDIMFRIIKCAFLQRRKTLLNALVNAKVFLSKEEGMAILQKLGLDVNVRPENLTLQDYANITDEINYNITKNSNNSCKNGKNIVK